MLTSAQKAEVSRGNALRLQVEAALAAHAARYYRDCMSEFGVSGDVVVDAHEARHCLELQERARLAAHQARRAYDRYLGLLAR